MIDREQIDGWEIVPDIKPFPKPIKGYICGKCNMKFEAGKVYGFYCHRYPCPMGFGGFSCGGEPWTLS